MGVLDIYGFEIFEVRDLFWDFDTFIFIRDIIHSYTKQFLDVGKTHLPTQLLCTSTIEPLNIYVQNLWKSLSV